MARKNFELLLRRMAREVRGLRQVQLYGTRGQAQKSIDIVGRNADDMGEAIQSKKYVRFTKKDLTDTSRATPPRAHGIVRGNAYALGREDSPSGNLQVRSGASRPRRKESP